MVRPHVSWLGRIIDAFGDPIDGKGPLVNGMVGYPLRASPPPAHARGRVGERLDLGVRAMDVFTTTCRGQRLGIFGRLRRRQVSAALDAGPRGAVRRRRRRPDRRTGP